MDSGNTTLETHLMPTNTPQPAPSPGAFSAAEQIYWMHGQTDRPYDGQLAEHARIIDAHTQAPALAEALREIEAKSGCIIAHRIARESLRKYEEINP